MNREAVKVRFPVYAQVGGFENVPLARLTEEYERYPNVKFHMEIEQDACYVFVEYTRPETDSEYMKRLNQKKPKKTNGGR